MPKYKILSLYLESNPTPFELLLIILTTQPVVSPIGSDPISASLRKYYSSAMRSKNHVGNSVVRRNNYAVDDKPQPHCSQPKTPFSGLSHLISGNGPVSEKSLCHNSIYSILCPNDNNIDTFYIHFFIINEMLK